MELVKIKDDRKTLYMDLLLIADEDVRMIEKYLSRGEMFALCDGDLKALCVVTEEGPGVYEIKKFCDGPKVSAPRIWSASHFTHRGSLQTLRQRALCGHWRQPCDTPLLRKMRVSKIAYRQEFL